MNQQSGIALLRRLLGHVENRTTALADAPWHNDVRVYTDPTISPPSSKSCSASVLC